MATPAGSDTPSQARERVLGAAYELFSTRGIRDVGVDELISRSGVAKATFYRHFPSKNDLILAFLKLREDVWTKELIMAEAARRGSTPEEQLLAIFDVFADWFRRSDFEGCTFINVLLEMGPAHPLGRAGIDYLAHIREHVRRFAEGAGLQDPENFSRSWHILMKGSIISAREGDLQAAARAKRMAVALIEQHRS